jgi:hypothetical protein
VRGDGSVYIVYHIVYARRQCEHQKYREGRKNQFEASTNICNPYPIHATNTKRRATELEVIEAVGLNIPLIQSRRPGHPAHSSFHPSYQR